VCARPHETFSRVWLQLIREPQGCKVPTDAILVVLLLPAHTRARTRQQHAENRGERGLHSCAPLPQLMPPLSLQFATYFVRRVMSSLVYGQLAGRPLSSSAAARSHQTAGRFSAAAATPLPGFACGPHRSLSTVHPVPALSSSALAVSVQLLFADQAAAVRRRAGCTSLVDCLHGACIQ
jgi:hypothetical protein